MKNKRLDNWKRKESISARRKSKVLSLPIAILFIAALLMAILFQFPNLLDGGITGAVTGLEILPSEENIGLNLTINDSIIVIDENITLNEINTTLNETNITLIIEPIVEEVSVPENSLVMPEESIIIPPENLSKQSLVLNEVVLNVSDSGSYQIQEDANPEKCGTVNSDLTLIVDLGLLDSYPICFLINASNIILDGNGHTITGDGASGGYGVVFLTDSDNVTIKNFAGINNFQRAVAVFPSIDTSGNITIYNNTINQNGSGLSGIAVDSISGVNLSENIVNMSRNSSKAISVSNSTNVSVVNNNLTNYGNVSEGQYISRGDGTTHTGANGISISNDCTDVIVMDNQIETFGLGDGILISGQRNLVQNNTIITRGADGYGVNLYQAGNTTILNQHITTFNNSGMGISIDSSGNNTINANHISTVLETSYGIELFQIAENNILLNNNISSTNAHEIEDTTGNSYINYLVYNNSFGEIRWINETNDGFLKNITLNGTLSLDTNLFIGDNVIALNASAFSIGAINTSANITIFGLAYTNANVVKKVDNYTTSSNDVLTHGVDCIGSSCEEISYDSSTGTLLFNVTSFSSFAADSVNTPPVIDTVVLNATDNPTNYTTANLTLYWNATDADLDNVKNITDWRLNGTSIATLNMPFENNSGSSFAIDYSTYSNNGTVDGAVWNATGGRDGKGAYEFTNDSIDLSVELFSDYTSNPSYSAFMWIKAESNGSLISQYSSDQGFTFQIITSKLRYWKADNPIAISTTDVDDVQWHHVGFTKGLTGAVALYVDGVIDGTGTDNQDPENSNVRIGEAFSGEDGYSGSIDDVLVFNHSLSPEQVLNLFNNLTYLLDANETSPADVWSACVTGNDGTNDSIEACSNSLTIETIPNNAPTVTTPVIYPLISYTNDTLNASTYYNDTDSDAGTVYFQWFVNDINVYNETNSSVTAGSNASTSLDQNNFTKGDLVNVTVYANDGTDDSASSASTILTISNLIIEVSNVVLNATDNPTNSTNANLTLYWETIDTDGDGKNITDWRLNKSSIAVLNMPFENISDSVFNATKDYSTFNNNGSEHGGVLWNATGGYDGKGSYEFDGVDDYISIPDDSSLEAMEGISIVLWVKPTGTGDANQRIVDKTYNGVYALYYTSPNLGFALVTDTASANDATCGVLTNNIWNHVVATWSSSSGKYECYINSIASGGGAPLAGNRVSNDANDLKIGTGAGSDFNGTIDDLMILNRSLTDEQIINLYNNKTNLLDANETLLYDTWQTCVTGNDGLSESAEICSNNLTIASNNNAPTVTTPVIYPLISYTNDTLNASTAYTDGDSDVGTVYFQWFVNDINVYNETNSSVTAGSNASTSLDPNNFTKGDLVNVTVYANDGTDDSAVSASTILTISNLAPEVITPVIYSLISYTNDTLNASTAYTDGDSEAGTVYFQWFVNDINVYNETNASVTAGSNASTSLDPNNFTKGDLVNVTVYANDGTDDSAVSASTILIISNLAPEVITPVIYPTTAYTNDTLNASTYYNDTDSDAGTVYFQWFVNDINVYNETNSSVTAGSNASTSLDPNNFSKGDQVNVTVYANDGTDDSETNVSTILTISNLGPDVSNVVLNATDKPSNTTAANLTLYWDVSDVDGDTSFTNITDWRLNGSSIAVLNMPIENNSATPSSTLIDYSILSNNATGGNGEFNLTAGRDGFGAMEFNGGNFFNLLSGSYTDYNGTDEFSVSIWVNMTEGDKTGNLETLIGAGFSNGWFVTLNESRPNFLLIDGDSNAWDCQSDTRVNDSTWHYLTYINNASGRSIFIDGTLDISCSDGPYRFATGGTSPRIGMKFGGSNAYTGTMDDLIIFNTSLSVGQILVLNSSTNNLLDSSLTSVDDTWQACVTSNDRFEDGTEVCSDNLTIIIFSDTTNPSVDAVNSPTARTNFTTGDIIVFNASVSDDVGVTSVLFQISNGSNPGNLTGSSTNSSLFNASLTVSSDSIVDGNHTLIVFASDAEGNIGTNSTVTFLVDTTSPETVELYNLTEGLNLTKNIPTFSFQVNDTWTTTLNCALVIDDEVNVSSISSANGTTINQLASRSIVDGFHNWSVNCNDSVNLNSNSITNNFTIDTSPPLVGPINNPIDRTNFTTGDNIVFNVTAINGSTESGVNVTDIHSVL
ncbi:MAG: LamG-like jellyroll fold domain-containing protein, partial [archaeon]|nr:LamG-like jellyroll fold domain-containing protein [archaeon]